MPGPPDASPCPIGSLGRRGREHETVTQQGIALLLLVDNVRAQIPVAQGVTGVTTYRAYIVGADGHFQGVHLLPNCNTDDEALQAAKQYVDGCDVQVWNLDRLVASVSNVGGEFVYSLGKA